MTHRIAAPAPGPHPKPAKRPKQRARRATRRQGMSAHHLVNVRKLPCACCKCTNESVEAHHLLDLDDLAPAERGMALKSTDRWVIPLCRSHHDQLHYYGSGREKAFLFGMDVHGPTLAAALWEARDNPQAMRRIVLQHSASDATTDLPPMETEFDTGEPEVDFALLPNFRPIAETPRPADITEECWTASWYRDNNDRFVAAMRMSKWRGREVPLRAGDGDPQIHSNGKDRTAPPLDFTGKQGAGPSPVRQ